MPGTDIAYAPPRPLQPSPFDIKFDSLSTSLSLHPGRASDPRPGADLQVGSRDSEAETHEWERDQQLIVEANKVPLAQLQGYHTSRTAMATTLWLSRTST
eukprot:1785471-Rhodomonas_salina.1